MEWVSTGVRRAELGPGSRRAVELEGRSVLLVAEGEELFAVAAECPHQGGWLPDGSLAGVRLTCPLHEAAFDIRSGAVLADPFAIEPPEGGVGALATYRVEVRDGVVWLGIR